MAEKRPWSILAAVQFFHLLNRYNNNFLAFGHKFLKQITYIILMLWLFSLYIFCIACFIKKYKGRTISISQTVKGLLVDYDLLFIIYFKPKLEHIIMMYDVRCVVLCMHICSVLAYVYLSLMLNLYHFA